MGLLSDPWYGGEVITPSNSDLNHQCTGLYVWTAGNLKFTTLRGDVIGPYAVVAGQQIPYQIKQVNTGTTAAVTSGLTR